MIRKSISLTVVATSRRRGPLKMAFNIPTIRMYQNWARKLMAWPNMLIAFVLLRYLRVDLEITPAATKLSWW